MFIFYHRGPLGYRYKKGFTLNNMVVTAIVIVIMTLTVLLNIFAKRFFGGVISFDISKVNQEEVESKYTEEELEDKVNELELKLKSR